MKPIEQGGAGSASPAVLDADREPTAASSPLGRKRRAQIGGDETPASPTPRSERSGPPSTPPPLSVPPPADDAAGGGTTVSDLTRPHDKPRTAMVTTRVAVVALAGERTVQADVGLRVIAIIALAGAVAIQAAQHVPSTHALTTGALGLLSVTAAVQYYRLKHGHASSDSWSITSVGYCAAVVACAMTAHVGVVSLATIVLPVFVYYFGLSDQKARAWGAYTIVAVGYLVAAGLAISGAFPVTASLVPLAEHSTVDLVFLVAFAEVVLAGTLALAMRSRRGTMTAMRQLESARRELRRQGALLAEAHAELDQVIDAGRIGRFTGTSIGPYQADEVLGRGGMGEVYRAVHEETGEPAAIKVLHPSLQDDRDQLMRFFREAEIASALRSPFIVEVYSTGRAVDGSPYIAMELLTGYDLAHALRKRRRLSEEDILILVSEVALALAAAQTAGIVHRDIKPQNLFFARSGGTAHWKILDFGISKMASSAGTLTQGALVGTPGYMSPEQARGLDVDPRSDIFSLGVIAYRVLTGRPAFSSPDPLVTLDRVARAMPTRPTDLVQAHEDVDLALAIALAKNANHRYRSATDFAAALSDAFAGNLADELRERARAVLREHPWDDSAVREEAAFSMPPADTGLSSPG